MWPILALAGLVAVLVGRQTGKCARCGRALRPVTDGGHPCSLCDETCCGDCLSPPPEMPLAEDLRIDGPVCKQCRPEADRRSDEYQSLLKRAESVDVFPHTYQGRIDVQPGEPSELVSDWWEQQGDVRKEIQILAVRAGCDTVLDLRLEKETRGGTPYYSVWRGRGRGCRRGKRKEPQQG